jgi:hypothetical protein
MVRLYGRAGRLTAENGGFWPGQYNAVERTPGITLIEDPEQIMYVCIVDVLTPYGLKKRAETLLTGTLMGGRDVSCQPPAKYARRFNDFVQEISMTVETE